LDACQSAGQMPLDVQAIGCDMLSATGRKYLRGPRGTGFLYVRRDLVEKLEPPFIDLHAADWTSVNAYRVRTDARRFENWETNFAGKLGLKVAFDYAMHLGLESIRTRVDSLADRFRTQLGGIRGVHVSDAGVEKSGIVTFYVDGMGAFDVKRALRGSAVNVSASDVAIARLDLEARGLPALVRASMHYYNTEDELDRACTLIDALSGQ
ncbi:MAG: aminotransferase class V-fold PLP-dependent enzyme, partial [Pseudomonadota bacterium]